MTFDVLCTIYVQHYTVAMTPQSKGTVCGIVLLKNGSVILSQVYSLFQIKHGTPLND
jgi:hypothetical protein